jgi:exopolyphosphatase/guanosine-5'-triphosphate,3'-diphosphate pyrophosphatase
MRLLSHDRQQRARALGAAVRLGCDLSGRSPELLAHSRLEFRANTVVLQADQRWAGLLLGEQTTRRAAAVAAHLGRDLKIRTDNGKAARRIAAAE